MVFSVRLFINTGTASFSHLRAVTLPAGFRLRWDLDARGSQEPQRRGQERGLLALCLAARGHQALRYEHLVRYEFGHSDTARDWSTLPNDSPAGVAAGLAGALVAG